MSTANIADRYDPGSNDNKGCKSTPIINTVSSASLFLASSENAEKDDHFIEQ